MGLADGGLASDYWHHYYTAEEITEIIENTEHTILPSGNCPIFVRLYEQPHPAPTVVMAHGMLVYGLILARLQLPLFRAGFNVVQFDLPGMGLSGGPRGGGTMKEILRAWKDAIDFALRRYDKPLFAMGVAEDGVSCYYVAANHPAIRALSLHTLFEYGDPRGVNWVGNGLRIKLQATGLAVASAARPTIAIKGTRSIPWRDVFGGPDDAEFIRLLENDPLGLQRVELRLARSLVKPQAPAVPFRMCRTPVQIIASDRNRIWPYDMLAKTYERLGGPKELVRLRDRPHWESNIAFHEEYCAHVVDWFRRWC